DALLAAQKAYKRLINALMIVKKLAYPLHPKSEIDEQNDEQIQGFCDTMLKGMQDDFNTAIAIGQLSNIVKKINSFYINPETIDTIKQGTFERMKSLYQTMIEDILGLEEEKSDNQEAFLRALLDLYAEAKEKKEYATVDKIRASFKNNNLIIKDLKNGVDWAYQE
ncbi:MAG: cysteine--tRNA ligase, partial [Bacteroidetes bacterium]